MCNESSHNVAHNFDDDGCCMICDFGGAEWEWWKNHTDEGKASDEKMPRCTGIESDYRFMLRMASEI